MTGDASSAWSEVSHRRRTPLYRAVINTDEHGRHKTCSGGGPVIVVPAEVAAQWYGTSPSPGAVVPLGWTWGKSGGPVCDYDRACDVSPIERTEYGGFGWLDVGGRPALVLDAEVTTIFVKDGDGGYIVRNSVGEDASERPTDVDDARWHSFGHATIELGDGRLFMFDSAYPGAADPAAIDADDGVGVIELGAGKWAVTFATSDGGVDFVRFRRA